MKTNKFIKRIKKYFHTHSYSKIIASQYNTFNYRDVVLECNCGSRIIQEMHHNSVYPFETNMFITDKEMKYLRDTPKTQPKNFY